MNIVLELSTMNEELCMCYNVNMAIVCVELICWRGKFID